MCSPQPQVLRKTSMSSPSCVLITGANRGIGLGLVQQMSDFWKNTKVFAAVRDVNECKELKDMCATNSNITLIKMDVTNEEDIKNAVLKVGELVGSNGLNVLINNSGVMMRADFSIKSEFDVPSTIEGEHKEWFDQTFAVNATAPFIITKNFLPLILKASNLHSNKEMGSSRALIVNVSSSMGSITENTSGGYYSYRMSKAAVNMLTKSLSVDLLSQKVLVAAVHPGWVRTRMGGSDALVSVDESTSALFKVISNLSAKDNGKCVRFDNGHQIPW